MSILKSQLPIHAADIYVVCDAMLGDGEAKMNGIVWASQVW